MSEGIASRAPERYFVSRIDGMVFGQVSIDIASGSLVTSSTVDGMRTVLARHPITDGRAQHVFQVGDRAFACRTERDERGGIHVHVVADPASEDRS